MEAWRQVEVAACEEMDGPTASDLEAIRAATFTVDAVQRREEITDHDVAAFVDVLSASAGPAGRWIHFGLTSSDVLDTALGLQLQAAGDIVVAGARELAWALAERAREHVDTVCVGRTHGVHAEPTTFGIKLAGFAMEAHRNALRLELAFGQAAVGALSGAVGTYASHPPAFEAAVLARLGLAARDGVHPGRPPRPARRAAPGDRARRRRARAPGHRDPPPAAHRGPRGRRAVPLRRPEGLERDAPQAQPDHERAHLRPRAGPARQRAARRSRTSPCGTSATSRTPAPSA